MSGATTGARTLPVDPRASAGAVLEAAARVLREGGLVVFPTETFYGLGADALDPDAVARVFAAKGRPADKPLLVLVDSLDMAARVAASLPGRARALIDRYWPGPLTLVLPARAELPSALTAGTGTIGVRIPGHPVARALTRLAGLPVTAPSANPHGAPSPRTAAEAARGLGGRVEMVLDAGATAGGLPSTIVEVTERGCRMLRAGAVTLTPDELGET